MVGVEPDGKQALGFVLVAVDGVALISRETKSDKKKWSWCNSVQSLSQITRLAGTAKRTDRPGLVAVG